MNEEEKDKELTHDEWINLLTDVFSKKHMAESLFICFFRLPVKTDCHEILKNPEKKLYLLFESAAVKPATS